ncbi:UvrD-helicase domain-containing protein [Amycolatopsis orientalis]|uniref:UvrD-helicase domain-containing protein n=1 Tax=Amycolatopsis orientalis TaxID=31958 RepID=UPI00055F0695|nr:UvrD-helicase domain-containing protein [Amycolatopsis orientalis]
MRRRLEAQAGQLLESTFTDLDSLQRNVLTALLSRTGAGWRLLVNMALPSNDGRSADAFLIGCTGVLALLITDRDPDDEAVRQVLRHAKERFAGISGPRGRSLAESAIHLAVIGSGAGKARQDGIYWSLTESSLDRVFRRDALHLDQRLVARIAGQAERRLRGYRPLAVQRLDRAPEADGLLDPAELIEDQLGAAQRRPFDSWLTFLHPRQNAIVKRDYSGPARISGPAGTGKTVVALHRLRHLARLSTGPLLFTTYVHSLPSVVKTAFDRLAPELEGRAEFTNLHGWVRRFLAERGVPVNVDRRKIDTVFSFAWMAYRERLQLIEPNVDYWRTELDRVIKGRGITTLDGYVAAARRGRILPLNASQREHVWGLYEHYQRGLTDKGVHDHNDLIELGHAELVRRPLETPYAAVVVDEVQDITLGGLKLLRVLAGDGPNKLLLVGDGQQQVYPGGWRLSDAGIPIQGRGELLKVNYRNRAEVLGFARRFDATNRVDDLDGAAGVTLRAAESASDGGSTATWRGTSRDLPDALVDAVRTLPVDRDHAALIVFHHKDLSRCAEILRAAGITTLALEKYTGEADGKLKIGTVHRAKGLDFQAVMVLENIRESVTGTQAEEERRELRGRQHLVAATRARDFLWWGVLDDTGTGTVTPAQPEPPAKEAECVHDMPISWCSLCRKPPPNVLPHGYRTGEGNAYHNDPDCTWLRKGQGRAHRQGKNVHDLVRLAWGSVAPGELEPCEFCCSSQWMRRHGH